MLGFKGTKLVSVIIMAFFILSAFSGIALSDEPKNEKSCMFKECLQKYLVGVELLTGYGLARLSNEYVFQGEYRVIPFYLDLYLDAKPLMQKIHINSPGVIQFVVEPFISYVYSPKNNVEAGVNSLLKIGLVPENWKFQLYLKGGMGMLYMSQGTREQSTKFNFNEIAGVGAQYYFVKDTALTVEYRYRHLSNGGIKKPNHGINTNFALCGIMRRF